MGLPCAGVISHALRFHARPGCRMGGGAGSASFKSWLGLPGGSPHPGATQSGHCCHQHQRVSWRFGHLGTHEGFRSSASAAGSRHQSTYISYYLTKSYMYTPISVCGTRASRLPERGLRAFSMETPAVSLPASITHTSVSRPRLRQPAPSRPATGRPVRRFVLGAGAASRRGTGVCLWSEQEGADGCVPREALCGNGVCGG